LLPLGYQRLDPELCAREELLGLANVPNPFFEEAQPLLQRQVSPLEAVYDGLKTPNPRLQIRCFLSDMGPVLRKQERIEVLTFRHHDSVTR